MLPADLVPGYQDAIGELGERDFLIIDQTSRTPRFVQVCLIDRELIIEASGPISDGGPADLTPDEQSWLIDLGFDPPAKHPDLYPNFRVSVGGAEVRRAAQLLVAAMSVLGFLGAECTVEGGNFGNP